MGHQRQRCGRPLRGAGMVNPKLPTGEIEIRVKELEVLSTSPTPPFTPDEHETVSEEKRLALPLSRPSPA